MIFQAKPKESEVVVMQMQWGTSVSSVMKFTCKDVVMDKIGEVYLWYNATKVVKLNIGDCIVKHSDGSVEVMTAKEFENTYERVVA